MLLAAVNLTACCAAILAFGTVVIPTTASAAVAVSPTACGRPLTSQQLSDIATWSDTSTISGASYGAKLEDAYARQTQINSTLVNAQDRRGVFSLWLQRTLDVGVMPMARKPGTFDHPEWANQVSYELVADYLAALHAHFTGTPAESHWQDFFDVAGNCSLPPSVATLAAYNTHLVIDLPRALADAHTSGVNAREFYQLANSIAWQFDVVLQQTKYVYGVDLARVVDFPIVNDALSTLTGRADIHAIGNPRILSAIYATQFANALKEQSLNFTDDHGGEVERAYRVMNVGAGLYSQLGEV